MSWDFKKLGEVTELQGGSQPPKSKFKYEEAEGYLRLLQIRDFKSDDKAVFIPKSKKNRLCYENDILIGRYGASVGKICTGKKGAYNVALMKATPDKELLNTRLYLYYLKSKLFQDELASVSSRSAQNGFSKDDIKDFIVPIPPISEQKQIVETLDKAFEKIDKAIANAEQNLQNAKELFESYLQNIFENKGNDWEEKPIKDLTKIVTKGSSPKWQGVNYVDEGGIFFLTSKNVGEGELLLKNKKYIEEKFNEIQKKTILKKGDVLTNIVGASIGRTAIFNLDEITNVNQAVCLMRCNSEKVYNYYLMYLLNSPFFKSILHDNEVDNARANLSLTFFKNLVIPLPKFEVQKEIVFKIKSFLEETKKLKAIYTQKIADLEELKKSILEKAFKGELTSAA